MHKWKNFFFWFTLLVGGGGVRIYTLVMNPSLSAVEIMAAVENYSHCSVEPDRLLARL